jgi:hypothetical protein
MRVKGFSRGSSSGLRDRERQRDRQTQEGRMKRQMCDCHSYVCIRVLQAQGFVKA